MKIKKIGHCCLVIEEGERRIMTDPGSWTVEKHSEEKNIDLIIITHEHGDHLHIDSLKKIIENNPNGIVVTNKGVGRLLDEVGIRYEILEDKKPKDFFNIEIEAYNCKHEEIFRDIFQVENTAFFIGKRLFYPGDSFFNPKKPAKPLCAASTCQAL
jgi:L-ascorbate metabolism protein UlaG (beta-lactamase superfamily)